VNSKTFNRLSSPDQVSVIGQAIERNQGQGGPQLGKQSGGLTPPPYIPPGVPSLANPYNAAGEKMQAVWSGYQPGFKNIPGFHLFHIVDESLPDYKSTVAEHTVKSRGLKYEPPPPPPTR
jgi:hypothetical protein